jgi:hypothetical protein
MILTGLIMRFALPPGSGNRRLLWSMGRHEWGDVHFWLAAAIGGVVLLHLALHWQWVCATVLRLVRPSYPGQSQRSPLWRNSLGIAIVLAVVALLVAFVPISTQSVTEIRGGQSAGSDEQPGRGHGRDSEGFIQGSMSLSEVAAARGMSVEVVKSRLGIPSDVSSDERLGRLSRRFGFSMQDVREKLGSSQASVDPD